MPTWRHRKATVRRSDNAGVGRPVGGQPMAEHVGGIRLARPEPSRMPTASFPTLR
ncbi:hypothetical protein BZL29_1170 [Mycobacterium kansasii]|uniref:Uncharacterized protein n=1 Tax=Mycobacterium kansasii TaxID=1768 RepID=A0A1V3Y0I2_MYCKA|nr:hypothetical protein BZL29_1170 [Mycobacterium kansasii]